MYGWPTLASLSVGNSALFTFCRCCMFNKIYTQYVICYASPDLLHKLALLIQLVLHFLDLVVMSLSNLCHEDSASTCCTSEIENRSRETQRYCRARHNGPPAPPLKQGISCVRFSDGYTESPLGDSHPCKIAESPGRS